jgi:tetratricopeptide (TPR) repeat protein
MKPTSIFIKAVTLAGSVVLAAALQAGTDAQFSKANQEYADGKFREAINDYEAVVQAGEWTANLFYDLGNAYFRTSNFGRAILNYERALALQPNHPEAQANLRIARDEARALELSPDWANRLGRFVTANQSAVAAAILFWAGLFPGVVFLFAPRRRRSVLALSFCALLSAGLLIFFLITLEHGPKGASLAVVTASDVTARLATADTSASVMALPAGSEVKVSQQRGDWSYVELPNNQRGWIPAKSVELVRM